MERRSLASEVRKNKEELDQLQLELQHQEVEKQNLLNKWEIYAGVIHDINGPLTIISGLLQMINQGIGNEVEIAGESLEQIKDRLKRITRQVTNCISISRRYLNLLRHDSNENVHVWVNQILGDLSELIRVHPCAGNNQIILHPLPEDVIAFINGTDLIQILLNLSWNALQCTPANHHLEIRGQLLQDPLELDHFQEGSNDRFINRESFNNSSPLLALSVQDNGPGIPPEIMPKIFEPFFSSKTRPQGTGTGLGLCIVHRLVKSARAALHVHSKPGQGSVFTLYLPAKSGGTDPAPAPHPAPAAP
jgi:signal transduction histidine kinase